MESGFELQVINQTVGVLSTNIEAIEKFVADKLQEYNPENYNGDADSAKKDRALLNNSKKLLAQKRIAIMKDIMKPYEDFETRCKKIEKDIDLASGKLDEIVKVRENAEKETKKLLCRDLWNEKNFDLFPMDKVFNPKWLNKGAKKSEISAEMDAIIEKTYKDLKMIERFADDAELLKAMYLEDLDIEAVFDRAEELQKNREAVQKEADTRLSREEQEALKARKEAVEQERKDNYTKNRMSSLVADALETEVKRVEKNFVLSFTATDEEKLWIEQFLLEKGIKWDSLEELKF